MKPSFFVFFLSTSTMIIAIILPVSTQTLIASSCKNFTRSDPNIDYDFCKLSLQAAPASGCATLRGLGSISIRLVQYNITDTRCHIKHLLKNPKLAPYSRQRLKDCLDLFSDAIPDAREAMRDYKARRFEDANIKISAIMDALTTCEDSFKEGPDTASSPITDRNRNVFELSAIALSIMSVMQRGPV